MFGVEYSYYDQFENTNRVFPVVFTDKGMAQAWIDDRIDAPYLRIIDLEVDPLPKPKFNPGDKVTRKNTDWDTNIYTVTSNVRSSNHWLVYLEGKDHGKFGVGEIYLEKA